MGDGVRRGRRFGSPGEKEEADDSEEVVVDDNEFVRRAKKDVKKAKANAKARPKKKDLKAVKAAKTKPKSMNGVL